MSKADRKVLAKGYTSIIYCHEDSSKVIKVLVGKNAERNFNIERRVYEHLSIAGRPNSILKFFGVDDHEQHGLVLERAAGGDLYAHIWHSEDIDSPTKWKWTRQACQALDFVHKQGIIHGDLHAINFFLDDKSNLKLADFGAASVIGGERPLMMYRDSHQLWLQDGQGNWRKDRSTASEIFALGCVLYNVETCHGLFSVDGKEIEVEEIRRRLKGRQYPSLDESLGLRRIIDKCWSLQYKSMAEILEDLPPEHEQRKDSPTHTED